MSLQVQVSKVIDRPVAEVFRFYAHEHVRNHPRWDPDMQLEQVSEGPIGVGTLIRRRNTHSGTPVEGTMEIIEFEPDRAMGVLFCLGAETLYPSDTFVWLNAIAVLVVGLALLAAGRMARLASVLWLTFLLT